jgi:hypothetical protein
MSTRKAGPKVKRPAKKKRTVKRARPQPAKRAAACGTCDGGGLVQRPGVPAGLPWMNCPECNTR